MRNVRDFESRAFYQHEVYLQLTRCEITQSSCKRDTKSKSDVGMKLAPGRVFSCKHPLCYEKRQLAKSKGIKLLIGECCDITMKGRILEYWRLIK